MVLIKSSVGEDLFSSSSRRSSDIFAKSVFPGYKLRFLKKKKKKPLDGGLWVNKLLPGFVLQFYNELINDFFKRLL